jgi:hypothetical protein
LEAESQNGNPGLKHKDMSTSRERVAALFSDVERLKVEHLASSLDRFSSSFFYISAKTAAWRKEAEEASAATASELNVFRLLKLVDLEMYHTRFLGDLLNPKGSHGQGKRFLKSFAEITCPATIQDFVSNADDIVTSIEYGTYFGRFDILIESNRFLIVIENKIGTTDAPDQLYRYRTWLDRQRKVQPDNRLLFYLTQGGDHS